MKIFIGWSSGRSREVAEALQNALEDVFQRHVEIVISTEIRGGTQWFNQLAEWLRDASFGIFVITPENVKSPWLYFEAGLLSCKFDDERFNGGGQKPTILPYLLDLKKEGFNETPLAHFNAVLSDRDPTEKMFKTINGLLDTENALSETELRVKFDQAWTEKIGGVLESVRNKSSLKAFGNAQVEFDKELSEIPKKLGRENWLSRNKLAGRVLVSFLAHNKKLLQDFKLDKLSCRVDSPEYMACMDEMLVDTNIVKQSIELVREHEPFGDFLLRSHPQVDMQVFIFETRGLLRTSRARLNALYNRSDIFLCSVKEMSDVIDFSQLTGIILLSVDSKPQLAVIFDQKTDERHRVRGKVGHFETRKEEISRLEAMVRKAVALGHRYEPREFENLIGQIFWGNGNFLEPALVILKRDRYLMGSRSDDVRHPDERLHEVKIDHVLEIGKYPVTFEEYDLYVEETGARKPDDEGWGRERRPVINVSWYEANDYAQWLSEKSGLLYRLPTEAEWEYAARAESTKRYHCGDSITRNQARYGGSEEGTVEVGSFPPNRWDLHDVHGNVWEWTCSEYVDDYSGAENDCVSYEQRVSRVVARGGAWNSNRENIEVSIRKPTRQGDRKNFIGFRLVRIGGVLST